MRSPQIRPYAGNSVPRPSGSRAATTSGGSRLAAQDVQPRVYTPAPVGVNAMTLNYAFSTGGLLFDKTVPVENVDGDVHSFTPAYSRLSPLTS